MKTCLFKFKFVRLRVQSFGILVIFCLFISNINAQTYFKLANQSDIVASNSSMNEVVNTGNDVNDQAGTVMLVNVWDGDEPTFAWDWDNGHTGYTDIDGTSIGTVTDPDVVLKSDGQKALIVYILYDGDYEDVYYETWEYSIGGNSWSISTNPTSLTTNQDCSSPNVDIYLDSVVVVYECDDAIYAHKGDIDGNFLGARTVMATNENSKPDVAVYLETSSDYRVRFTYIQSHSGYYELYTDEGRLIDIIPNAGGLSHTHLEKIDQDDGSYGPPRIATPNELPTPLGFSHVDYCLVVSRWEYDADEYFILEYGKYGGILFSDTLNDSYIDLTPCENILPVVTYSADVIRTSWAYHDCLGSLNSDFEVISRETNNSGVLNTNYYSVVNKNLPEDQTSPSISGRFHPVDSTFYSFYCINTLDVLYKTSQFCNMFLSPGPGNLYRLDDDQSSLDDEQSLLYTFNPNPANNNLEITVKGIRIYGKASLLDKCGKTCMEFDLNNGNNKFNISSLNSGLYILRFNLDNNIYSKKLIIVH